MKKILKIFMIILIFTIALIPSARANGFKFTPTPSATTLGEADTLKISLKLSNIDAGEKGINTFQCELKYDEEIFEEPVITSKNNWSITYNNNKTSQKYGTFLAVIMAEGVKKDQEIGEISLKVKNGTKGKKGIITFTDVTTNDGKESIVDENKTLNITIKNLSGGGSTVNENKIINTNPSQKIDTNANNKQIPFTGGNVVIAFISVLVGAIVLVIALNAYKKYRKIK